MCGPGGTATIMAGYQQKKQGEFQNDIAKHNARQLENQAIETRNKGTEEENIHRQKVAQLVASQRARLGASNASINSGSGLQLQDDTIVGGEADALRIRSNFKEEAATLTDRGSILRAEGKAKQAAGKNAYTASLFKAGGDVASSWYQSSA